VIVLFTLQQQQRLMTNPQHGDDETFPASRHPGLDPASRHFESSLPALRLPACVLVCPSTSGDKTPPLKQINGEGIFVQEICIPLFPVIGSKTTAETTIEIQDTIEIDNEARAKKCHARFIHSSTHHYYSY
jgi:hypothetical protein